MNKKATVIGIGRLGLCFALTLERGGYNVVGVDIQEEYIKSINSKTFLSPEPKVNEYLNNSKNFRATTNLKDAIDFSDIIFVTLRTESLPSGKYDHCQIENFLSKLINLGKQKEIKDIVICSNVCPGYSNEVHQRIKHLNYSVSFNPEWVAQGTIIDNQDHPDLVVIGEDNKDSGDKIENIYKNICSNNPPIHRMDRLSAEITKIGLNCFLTTKITYANMMGEIAIQSGVDPEPILKAIGGDSRINTKYFNYGFGYGGPCFYRDAKAFINYSNKLKIKPSMIIAAEETNKNHLKFQLNEFFKNNSKDKPIIFESVTYKKGVILIEESQQLLFAAEIAKNGYKVIIKEHVNVVEQVKEIYGDLFTYE